MLIYGIHSILLLLLLLLLLKLARTCKDAFADKMMFCDAEAVAEDASRAAAGPIKH